MSELTVEQRLGRLEDYALGKCYRCDAIVPMRSLVAVTRPYRDDKVNLCYTCEGEFSGLKDERQSQCDRDVEYWLTHERDVRIMERNKQK